MVAADIIELVKQWKFESDTGLTDFADTISSFWSILTGLVCTMIVTVKVYGMSPIVCHCPITFSGSDFPLYINNYCFVEGSIAIPQKEVKNNFPQNEKQWKKFEDKGFMSYYPWVPLFLSFTALLPFLVSTMWKVFYSRRAGTNYQHLVDMAVRAQSQDGEERSKSIEQISNGIVDTLNKCRDEERENSISKFPLRRRCKVFSRKHGSLINVSYFLMKLAYLCVHAGTLTAIHYFLGLRRNYVFFGLKVLSDIINERYWDETGMFPRVTFCKVPLKHNHMNYVIAQCAVPVNLLNEALFVFLWFWHVICLVVMLLSIFVWLYRAVSGSNKDSFVRKSLILSGIKKYPFSVESDHETHVFTNNFLLHDGVFILQMLNTTVGCSVTTDIIANLWRRFKQVHDWRCLPKPVKVKNRKYEGFRPPFTYANPDEASKNSIPLYQSSMQPYKDNEDVYDIE